MDYGDDQSEIGRPGTALIDRYGLENIDSIFYIGAILKVDSGFNLSLLDDLNVKEGSRTGGSMSIKIPVQNVEKLNGIQGIRYVDIDRKVNTH